MKALPFIIVTLALLLGVKQGLDSGRLTAREKELRGIADRAGIASGKEVLPAVAVASAAAKTERSEKPKFDPKLYLDKFRKLMQVAMTRGDIPPGDEEFIQRDLLDATTDEILQLAAMLDESGISDEFGAIIYESAAPRLLDKDPAIACDFAIKGGDITTFILIIRAWIARDPMAAGNWLGVKSKADPPLNEKSLSTHASHLEPLDVPSLQLAVRIAASPSAAELEPLTKLEGPKLNATLDDLLAVLPPDGLPVLLKRFATSGSDDLLLLAMTRHPEPALAREYLKNAGLPPEHFAKLAQTAISQLDPASLPKGMEWYLQATRPEERNEGLREIVKSWTHENSRSAAAWIASLPDGAHRQQAQQAHDEALAHPRPKKFPER